MTTKAATDFTTRGGKNSRDFKTWYHNEDVHRILSMLYFQLDLQKKREIEQPCVITDGLPTFESMLDPLVEKFSSSDKKYLPFAFKPELASAHYMAGFLRKNKDNSMSIFIFNPTGTTPRVDFGKYGYSLRSMEQRDNYNEFEKNIIYVKARNGTLVYSVINQAGKLITNSLSKEQLVAVGVDIDLSKPLTSQELDKLKIRLQGILKITLERGETEKKIELLSSPHKVQTQDKDGGPLISCGPLSIEFIAHIMNNPDYMERLTEDFELPPFLEELIADNTDTYRAKIKNMREAHFALLAKLDDDRLEIIDGLHASLTNYFFEYQSNEDSEGEGITDEMLYSFNNDDDDSDDDDDLYEYPTESSEKGLSAGSGDTKNNVHERNDVLFIKSQDKDLELYKKLYTHPTEFSENSLTAVTGDKKNIHERNDVLFIKSQIERYRENAKCVLSINNTSKADMIQQALDAAIESNCNDVRTDPDVVKALAIHRIFSFFGSKDTKATILNIESLTNSPLI